MNKKPTEEQISFINSPLANSVVKACPGSGKTMAAVMRLYTIRKQLTNKKKKPILLSFSNVAVTKFRDDYIKYLECNSRSDFVGNVLFETMDGFLTKNILKPHSHRTMGSKNNSFLAGDDDPILENFKVSSNEIQYPIKLSDITISSNHEELSFSYTYHNTTKSLDSAQVTKAINSLAKAGGYTHELGRYWSLKTLIDQPFIMKALANKFPYIIIDEAQDLTPLQQDIVYLFIKNGIVITVIGDKNQTIYEFTGADSMFLDRFTEKTKADIYTFTKNFRSTQEIVSISNKVAGRSDTANRVWNNEQKCYFTGYDEPLHTIKKKFQESLDSLSILHNNAVILFRANKNVNAIYNEVGVGSVKDFVSSALNRDINNDYFTAFQDLIRGLVKITPKNPDNTILSIMRNKNNNENTREIRRLLWMFLKDPARGLPSCTLPMKQEWFNVLKSNLISLTEILKTNFSITCDDLTHKITRKNLSETSFITNSDDVPRTSFNITTVHKVKGESKEAVLYVANKNQINDFLKGPVNENGRIGYVALTRAEDIFWLGVPNSCINQFRDRLIEIGLKEI